MNVRIDKDAVRFRITSEDLAVLLQGSEIAHQILNFKYRIVPSADAAGMDLKTSDQGFVLTAPFALLHNLQGMGRSRDGLSVRQGNVEVSLQVDLKALSRRA